MEIHERPCEEPGVRVLAVDGGLDQTNTGEFVEAMDRFVAEGTARLVLDLEHLTYVSSWGLAALVRAHHHFAARGGRLAFANLHTAVTTVLRVSRLDRLFDLYPSVTVAVAAVRPEAESPGGVEPGGESLPPQD